MYVNISVVLEVLKWTMLEANTEYTFTKLLEVVLDKTSCCIDVKSGCKCYLSHDKATRVEVPLEFIAVQCCELNGRWVRFVLPGEP